ncbi:MAG: xanthine dehydrogenase family protein molybdopterin-binding subunit [Acidimicrobiales bacterium]
MSLTSEPSPTSGGSILGHEVRRVEDPRMLRSGGVYVDDIDLPGAAHVHFVRATTAHAELLDVDVSEAIGAPGVLAVVTGDDLDGHALAPLVGDAHFAQALLARGRVRYVGEPIAAVVATDRYLAADAAELVIVDYEPLPAVVDPRDALADDVVLFEEAGTNVCRRVDATSTVDFGGCDVVTTVEIVNQRIYAAPIEPRVAAAAWGEDGRLVCWSSTQGADPARNVICEALSLETDQVRMIIPDVGGAFGAKARPGPEEALLGFLARRVDRPVRWSETRNESLLSLGHGRGQVQTITLGGTSDGDLTHLRLEVLGDAGAYPKIAPFLHGLTLMMATGTYGITEVETSATSVVTNTAPVQAFRGAGRPEAAAAIERAVDAFAAQAGLDPADVRRRNLLAADVFPYTTPGGFTYDNGAYHSALETALDAVGYDDLRVQQRARRGSGDTRALGIGLSSYVEVTAPGAEHTEFASVELCDDGSILARTGATPYGQGHATTWAMLIADRTGVAIPAITLVHGDTDAVPSSGITGGSRSVQVAGSSMADAAEKLAELAREVAAELLEAAVDDIVLDSSTGRFHVQGTPARSVGWSDVAAETPEPLAATSDFVQHGSTFPFGSHVAVVEVDTETGAVELVRFVAVDDAGTLINPLLAAGQIHGGLAAGIAQALLEEVVYDADGNLLTSTFTDYTVISAAELPDFDRIVQETPTPLNPLGAKGIGESGTVGATPAVQNAVVDALAHLGVRHVDMPTTPRRVFEAIRAAGS